MRFIGFSVYDLLSFGLKVQESKFQGLQVLWRVAESSLVSTGCMHVD